MAGIKTAILRLPHPTSKMFKCKNVWLGNQPSTFDFQLNHIHKNVQMQKRRARETNQQRFNYHVQMQKRLVFDFQINYKNGQIDKRRVRKSYQGQHRPTMFLAKIRTFLIVFSQSCSIFQSAEYISQLYDILFVLSQINFIVVKTFRKFSETQIAPNKMFRSSF